MRRASLVVALLVLSAPARAETPADFPAAISVTGEAQISVAPFRRCWRRRVQSRLAVACRSAILPSA